ncbi:MAG TPA: protein translocase subunit SecF [Dehalococcoidales bacterium]
MINIVSNRLWFFIISSILLVVGIVSLSIFGLKTGIDFASGSLLTVKFEQTVIPVDVEKELPGFGFVGTVETDAQGNIVIRTVELTAQEKTTLKDDLTAKFGALTELGFENVDPIVAKQTAQAAIWATAIASIGILLYIAFAFRKMPKPFHFGVCAVAGLLLDVIVVLGVFSILGKVANWEIDLALVTGILTVIGYAVNDTIVVFDRIRENQKRYPGVDFGLVVNNSLMDVMTRELATGVGVLFVLIALLLFVGPTIKNLVVVLMVGIYFGTFTSVFVAAPLLVVWEKGGWGSLFSRKQIPNKTAEVRG